MNDTEHKMADQLERTNKLLTQLEKQRYLQMVDRPAKFLFMSFMQGIAVALGSTLGVAIVIYVFGFVFRRLEILIPLNDYLQHLQNRS